MWPAPMQTYTGFVTFSETNFQDFSRTWIDFQGSKIYINPYTPNISMLILLTTLPRSQ